MTIPAKRSRLRLSLLIAAAALLALVGELGIAAGTMATSTVNVSASADAYVNSQYPKDNYGSATSLRVDASPTARSYLSFDLTGVGGSVVSAQLRLYANSESPVGYKVALTSNRWRERTIDYSNAPALGSVIASSGGFSADTWTAVDVTSAAKAGSVVDFGLVDGNDTMINIASRESSHPPVLVLTVSSSSTSASPSAVPLATSSPSAATATTPPTAPPTSAATATPAPSTAATALPALGLPSFSHIYVILMENHEYSSIVGSSSAPYINSLIAKYGLATNYYAVTHPSEPNYIALTSGGTQGVTDDGTYNLNVNNVFAQVSASGRTWKAIMQGYPGNCFTGSSSASVTDGVGLAGSYVRKHDPAISYTDISGNSTQCANITNLASFNPGSANFFFITPNLINDMHDGTIADGDNFLKAFVPEITGSSAFSNSVLLITWDEGSTNLGGGGHVATIAIAPGLTAGYKASATYSHYSLLALVEAAWGLSRLGAAGSATPLSFPW